MFMPNGEICNWLLQPAVRSSEKLESDVASEMRETFVFYYPVFTSDIFEWYIRSKLISESQGRKKEGLVWVRQGSGVCTMWHEQ
jgi:hypothetical protein